MGLQHRIHALFRHMALPSTRCPTVVPPQCSHGLSPLIGITITHPHDPIEEQSREWIRNRQIVSHMIFVIDGENLLSNPPSVFIFTDAIPSLLNSHAGTMALKLLYGRDEGAGEDPLVKITEKAVEMMANVMFPAALIINTFPSCKLLVSALLLPFGYL